MTENQDMVDRYYGRSCLTDDVEWKISVAFHARGNENFAEHIVEASFVGRQAITVTRLTEENDVLVAGRSVHTQRTDGTFLNLTSCDVLEMQGSKIRQLLSYLMETV